jgi:hypothetical protein
MNGSVHKSAVWALARVRQWLLGGQRTLPQWDHTNPRRPSWMVARPSARSRIRTWPVPPMLRVFPST